MELQNIRHLLDQVSAINKQYQKIADITGENFNIFKILGLSTSEVRTHTAFIAELLNPKGSHGQKEVFLELFCQQLEIDDFDSRNAETKKEYSIGNISEDEENGGSIDILITDGHKGAIVIENKIYAGDQSNQLFRYYNHVKDRINYKLFYLTLDGKEASHGSKCGIPKGCIKNISYDKHILAWLEKCKEKAANQPILRETLTQYIYLIKALTDQTINNEMGKEIVSVINSTGYNIAASIEIASLVEKAKKELLVRFAQNIKVLVERSIQDVKINISPSFGDAYSDILFELSDLPGQNFSLNTYGNLSSFTLLIFNDTNGIKNVNYYEDQLKHRGFGRIEPWSQHWAWACRYQKLDSYFMETKSWVDLADNNPDDHMLKIVTEDIVLLIETIRKKDQFLIENQSPISS